MRRRNVVFVEGGHGHVYPWIPKTKILVERMLNRQDECAIAYHEMREQWLMRYKHMKYENAHAVANREEQKLRRSSGSICKRVERTLGIRWR